MSAVWTNNEDIGNVVLWNLELIKTFSLCLPSSDTVSLEPGVGEDIMLPPYLQEKEELKLSHVSTDTSLTGRVRVEVSHVCSPLASSDTMET